MNTPLTFLFTDLENSTQLWEHSPQDMHTAMAQHDALLTESIARQEGQIVKSTGDGFHAVFKSPADAILAALEGQKSFCGQTWPESTGPLKVRMGLHTGDSEARDGDFFGPTLNRAARVMDIAHGGQVLLSEATASLAKNYLPKEVILLDKGQHRLKGIASLEHIYQLSTDGLQSDFPPLRSLEAYKHNLHRQLTSFIGRENELSEVKTLLAETQLLTLLGPGGTGKTRLMLQVAEEVIDQYPDGVWLVELAPLTNPNKLPDRVAAALNVQEQPGRTILDTLHDYLRQKELLLLLDNVEHLVRECAEFVVNLLEHCPEITILVTGREALFISGEITRQIPSLSLPNSQNGTSFEEIRQSEGVILFLERAKAVRPDFKITPQNASAIAEIVKRLDGIPLALELAASRLRMLTVEQITDRLNDRFRLLTGGHRTALPRQQTLQALIDWSWNLLDQDEQLLLRRLSVFAGGWNLNAAQKITSFDPLDEFLVFDLLDQLINKSMVTVEYPSEGKARYSLLESIRQYAQEKLFEAGEGEELRNRHTEYFVSLAQDVEPHLLRSTMLSAVKRIEQELDNLRAAITWCLETRPELALRISGALLYRPAHWLPYSESKSWLLNSIQKSRSLLEADQNKIPVEDFIKGLIGLATAYAFYSDHTNALAAIDEALQLAKESHHLRHYAYAVLMKTTIYATGGGNHSTPEWIQTIEEAFQICLENNFEIELNQLQFAVAFIKAQNGLMDEAMALFHAAEKRSKEINNPYRNGEVFRIKAIMYRFLGDSAAAEKAMLEAIQLYIEINDQRFTLVSQSDLAHYYRRLDRWEDAIKYYKITLPKWLEQGNLPAFAHQLESVAFIAIHQGKYEHAARLLGNARAARSNMAGEPTIEIEMAELNQAMQQLSEAMNESDRERLMLEGEALSLGAVVQLALDEVLIEPMQQ